MLHTAILAAEAAFEGVKFDSESAALIAQYNDELSLFRAKKVWTSVLKNSFLLENSSDYTLASESFPELGKFVLECNFNSACGRYTFWRITNSQSPEAQYLIETAHIPLCASRHEDLIKAPDMQPLMGCSPIKNSVKDDIFLTRRPMSKWLEKLLNNLTE